MLVKEPMNFSMLPPIQDMKESTHTRGISLASPPRRRKRKKGHVSSVEREMQQQHNIGMANIGNHLMSNEKLAQEVAAKRLKMVSTTSVAAYGSVPNNQSNYPESHSAVSSGATESREMRQHAQSMSLG